MPVPACLPAQCLGQAAPCTIKAKQPPCDRGSPPHRGAEASSRAWHDGWLMIEVSFPLASPRSQRATKRGGFRAIERDAQRGEFRMKDRDGTSEDQWKSKLPGPVLQYTIGSYIKNRAGKLVAISPLAFYVTGLPTGSLEPQLTSPPKLLGFCRPLEREKSKNGRFLVHLSIPYSLPTGHLEASWLHELPCPILCSLQSCRRREQFDPPRGGRGGQPMRHSSDRIGQGEGINC